MNVGVYVIPAKAGIQYHCLFLDSRLCGNDRLKRTFVMQLSIIDYKTNDHKTELFATGGTTGG
jgi:hypothetical protein